ncbi:DUF3732 domain-containing protein [Fodinibius halophilus]|uniref:DUF3732 domain-containing protein n=1 Tax=Fodinibius halophilus TaxID=1736908 RepID=A0A6M1TH87_9BACT|nr:DUF3732 domain-containing protein [Fodinibius halophilus]NGP88020.1 DUF3732 domain-containing protein [Fodinibius halophilus]
MKSFIHELGVIDKLGETHPVYFKQGLNVVTGKSSTGKSALIEIFDYCFGSSEYTVPKGIITDNAALYYVYLNVNGQNIVLGRLPDKNNKAFLRREDNYYPDKISRDYFSDSHFIQLNKFKKHLTSFFLDIDDVDTSLTARKNRRYNRKASTPSIRSFVSFMMQHQNLIANKHAIFYRFDEKQKREQVIEHTKIFLGLVDQNFFHLSQEKERLSGEINKIKRKQETNRKLIESQKQKIEPVLRQLYASMGFDEDPISLQEILRHPNDAQERLDEIIQPDKIRPLSNALTERHIELQKKLSSKTSQLRKLQRKAGSINQHINAEKELLKNAKEFQPKETINIAKSVCPFCHTEHEQLQQQAEHLQKSILKLADNLKQARPMRSKFQSLLIKTNRQMEDLGKEISDISDQIAEIDKAEKDLEEKESLYETILDIKTRLFVRLESLNLSDDLELEERLKKIKASLKIVESNLREYDYKAGLEKANKTVNRFMAEIGEDFEFEESYKPINLHFSFETFDLYHLNEKGEKIFLRSMGSGANWLYSHITLFLALHKYFASLGEACAIPSILFFDQPTQVYFPSFKFDKSEKFDKEAIKKLEPRDENERQIDDDIIAVENLFTQLSIYCTDLKKTNDFTPQIIVTDHADNLELSDGTQFETLVKGNRWRKRGLIDPVPI